MSVKKSEIMKFRVTPEQRMSIEAKADQSGLSISEYLRACALDKPIVVIEGVDEMADELRRIGVNINQLTRAANSGYVYVIDLSEVRKELKSLWRWLSSLRRVVR